MFARRGNTIPRGKRQASLISKFCINDWELPSNIPAETSKRFPTHRLLLPCLLLRWRRRVGIEPT